MIENLLVIGYLLFIVAPVGTLIHETGHAIGAGIVKADHVQLSIGLGKKIKSFSLKNFHITIHLLFFLGGFVKSNREPTYQPMEWLTISAFGPLHNIFYAIFFYYISVYFQSDYVRLLFLFNLWLAMVNIIPFKIRGKQSDGYTILQVLTKD